VRSSRRLEIAILDAVRAVREINSMHAVTTQPQYVTNLVSFPFVVPILRMRCGRLNGIRLSVSSKFPFTGTQLA
jgi:hypothetical protein